MGAGGGTSSITPIVISPPSLRITTPTEGSVRSIVPWLDVGISIGLVGSDVLAGVGVGDGNLKPCAEVRPDEICTNNDAIII